MNQASAQKICNLCLNEIKKYCNNSSRAIIEEKSSPRGFFSLLGGNEAIAVTDNDIKTKVINLFSDYWLSFVIIFGTNVLSAKKIEYELRSIFLSVFYGNKYDNKKELLFRADWSANMKSSSEHAQPHWHYRRPKELSYAEKKDFNTFIDLKQTYKEIFGFDIQQHLDYSFDLSPFHFAISSDWHNEDSHILELEEKRLAKWLQGCLCYIKKQLEYCDSKRNTSTIGT